MRRMRKSGGGLGKGGTSSLFVNGKKVAAGRIARTQCCVFSVDEGTDVGADEATSVAQDHKERENQFTGKAAKVTINLAEVKSADNDAPEKSHMEAALKKALSDWRIAMVPTPAEALPLQLLRLRPRGDGAEAGGRGLVAP